MTPLYPVFTVANVENNEIRIENNAISGPIRLALFSIRRTLVSHYTVFSSVCRTDANVFNCLNHSRLSRERRRMQNNMTRGRGAWRMTRGKCDPIHCDSLFISHYSLHSRQWKRGIIIRIINKSSGEKFNVIQRLNIGLSNRIWDF